MGPTLTQANEWLIHGRYAEAAAAFEALKEKNPGTRVFDIGLQIAHRAMALQNEREIPDTVIHPASRAPGDPGTRLFCVATAVRNGEPFLTEAMESVLSQEGDFFIDYFVKDAESTDGTLETLRAKRPSGMIGMSGGTTYLELKKFLESHGICEFWEAHLNRDDNFFKKTPI